MRVRPGEVPEPPQRAGAVGVRRERPGPVAVLMALAGLVRRAGPVGMAGLVGMTGPVSVASVTPARLRISHDIQDARNSSLQHLDNSQPGATANYPQPGSGGRVQLAEQVAYPLADVVPDGADASTSRPARRLSGQAQQAPACGPPASCAAPQHCETCPAPGAAALAARGAASGAPSAACQFCSPASPQKVWLSSRTV
jgi:hypothetical protein